MEVSRFFWYVKAEDFDDLGNLDIDISAGRLRHRWVPQNAASAKLYLRNSPDAEGLRLAEKDYILVTIILAEPIKDLSADYPNARVPGILGHVIRVPFKHTLMPTPKDWEVEEGIEVPAITYRVSNKAALNTYPSKQFGSLELGLLSAEDIRAMSKVEIVSAGAFQDNNPEDQQTPVLNGVQDLRMGAVDNKQKCTTCYLAFDDKDGLFSCQGHFGHIELATPIPKLQFLGTDKYAAKNSDPLLNALNKVCYHCSRIMIPQGLLDSLKPRVMSVFENNKRNYSGFTQIRDRVANVFKTIHKDRPEDRAPCPHCLEFSPQVKFSHTNATFSFIQRDERYQGGATSMDFRTAQMVLKNIIDEDVYFLGMDPSKARPEDMFFECLPVAPNVARPERVLIGKKLKELDDLTKLYQDVVYANEKLDDFNIRNVGNQNLWTKKLYLAVSRVYDNQKRVIGSGGTSQERGYGGAERAVSYKGVMNRLTGKKGRFRNNLQSKYVRELMYSIITPHAALALDEVGVPKQAAMIATTLETVTGKNIKRLKEMAMNGSGKYPGINYVYPDGDTANLATVKDVPVWGYDEEFADRNIIEGAVVKRHIINGDIALFNRAPSLHRQSVLAMRCRIMESKSLAMNPTVCIPFNADYDGDAMKLHFVQSERAVEEAKRLMLLDKNIIHARYGKLTVATDQDQTSGLYLLTHTNKRRRNEWNSRTGLGFTNEGLPYVSKKSALSAYTYVFSEIRNEKELKELYREYKRNSVESPMKYDLWLLTPKYRTVNSLPESDVLDGDGNPAYTGRALFNHLFTVLDCEYVSATFVGNSPAVDESGKIERKQGKKMMLDKSKHYQEKVKERIIVYKGKLIQGTLEKDSFGEGGSSLAPSFIYHEGYEGGQAKLVEYIEMVTRLGYAGHLIIGYTMGIDDVGLLGQPEVQKELDDLYDDYSTEMTKWTRGHRTKNYLDLASPEERTEAVLDPAGFINEKIVALASEYEKRILGPIEDSQGSGNPMQIAVRSKARGKDENVRQMGGSFGIVLVGGKRIVHGINSFRALPHFPLIKANGTQYDIDHPIHTGFVQSGYAKGMSPTEYWQTSSAGRRSTVESGQGQIATSGYLERKMIKALEPMVVNEKKQVINIRTGRIINPLIGDDGLAPYHIRGSHKDVNKSGHTLTLQPLLFEFECKHGKPLEDAHTVEYSTHGCDECSKPVKWDTVVDELNSFAGFTPSAGTRALLKAKIENREVPVPTLRKIAKKLHEFHNDSICRTGEAIGATAGGCLGEPATQSALRSFHFAGKMSFQGSVDRLVQILESPLKGDNIKGPQVTVNLSAEANSESMANKLASICTNIPMSEVVDLIKLNPEDMTMAIVFNPKKLSLLKLSTANAVVLTQIRKALKNMTYEFVSKTLDWGRPFIIKLLSPQRTVNTVYGDLRTIGADRTDMLLAKESILSANVSGITQARLVKVNEKDGQYSLDIRDASNETLKAIVERLGEYLDLSTLKTNNLGWIYKHFGLEAFLHQFISELDFQMNGDGGIGEYDVRYIRMIADVMGEEGEPLSLGPKQATGLGSGGNYSVLSAASTEGAPNAIMGGAIMGNYDPLEGPAEAIVTGAVPSIGDYVPTF